MTESEQLREAEPDPRAIPQDVFYDQLWARCRLAREGAAVERCHAHPHLMRYSVGHHTLDMASLIVLTWMAAHNGAFPSSALLVATIIHDLPERVTGDLPSPLKALIPGPFEAMEQSAWAFLLGGRAVALDEEESAWLRAADAFELWAWALEEAGRGNSRLTNWVKTCLKGRESWPLVFQGLVDAALRNPQPLVWDELAQIGGLPRG